jgi:hypothetical protein
MPRSSSRQPALKPQDLYLLLALAAIGDRVMTYPELAAFSGLSMSEVHAALKRAAASRLLFFDGKRPRLLTPALKEFLLHGARYAFPVVRGSMVVGIPTAHAAAPLKALIAQSADPPPVWAAVEGSTRGVALVPLYNTAPAAAQRSPVLHENLALFDALRVGNARERKLASEAFEARL